MDKAKLAIVAAAYTEANAKIAAAKPTKDGGVNRSVIVGAARGIAAKLKSVGVSESRAYTMWQTWERNARAEARKLEGKAA